MKKQSPAPMSPWPTPRVSRAVRYRERIEFAFALSLSVHALILALRFGAAGFGLPWSEEREPGLQLSVRLSDVPRPPAQSPPPPPAPPAVALRESREIAMPQRPRPQAPSPADTSLQVRLVPRAVEAPPAPLSAPRRVTRAPAPAARARARDRKIRPRPAPQILAQNAPKEETFRVPAPKRTEPEPQRAPESVAKPQVEETPPAEQPAEETARRQAEEAARVEKEDAARRRAEEDARQAALTAQKEAEAKKQQEARRLEEARKQEEARRLELEARKLAEDKARHEVEELARQRAVALQKEQEAKRLEEARKTEEAQKQEAARIQEELKKEEASRLALKVEALKRAEEAAARAREMAAQRQKEQEARRQAEEAARAKEAQAQAAAQRERDLLAARPPGASGPGALSGSELAAKAIDQLRNAGTPRGDPARPPSQAPSADNTRRRSIFGIERDVGLRMYVDSWRWKIERNGALNYRPSAGFNAPQNPIVTVAIRSDGSLEDVWIHRSSGLRELDQAVLRIARTQAPYSAFPPALARQYDVIQIRRVWSFDTTLRIMEEM